MILASARGLCDLHPLNRGQGTEPLKDNMEPYHCAAQWNTADWQEGKKRKIKGLLEAGVNKGLLNWAFTGVCSVSLKQLSYMEAENVGHSSSVW